MAGISNIEWTDATWNPIVGCSIVSPGCTNCYAMTMAARLEAMNDAEHEAGRVAKADHYHLTTKKVNGNAVWTGKVALAPDHIITAPLRWRKPRRIFVNSMGDLFHESIPDEWIDRVFAVMALARQHTFQVLTKRAERMRAYFKRMSFEACGADAAWAPRRLDAHACELSGSPCAAGYMEDVAWPLSNLWLGISAERQQEADERIPHLLQTPAAVRFVSLEPLLGPIDLRDITDRSSLARPVGEHHFPALPDPDDEPGEAYLDWVICGGESGPHARPMHPDWARSLRDQCGAAGVPFHFKQWGEWAPHGGSVAARGPHSRVEMVTYHNFFTPDGRIDRQVFRVGKKRAGRLLDGRTHDAFPEVRAA